MELLRIKMKYMKKIIFISIIIVIVLIGAGIIYVNWLKTNDYKYDLEYQKYISKYKGSDCAKEGEKFSKVFTNKIYSGNPKYQGEIYLEHCCFGLYEYMRGVDTRKVVDGKCVSTGLESGNPVGICLACGNGTCDKHENICSCPKDCK